METTKAFLADLLVKSPADNKVFQRNILKEYLQIFILDFIYSHKRYSRLFFYGGSCLSHCFGLPRLSEDLDFVDLGGRIKLSELAGDVEDYLTKETDIKVKTTIQKFRIYLKFSVLSDLGLAGKGESDFLFLKLEVFSDFKYCRKFKTEIVPVFKFNRSILIKTFDLPTLMATKIMAVLRRKWEKTDKKGRLLATVKGRDYFDLMWYLEKGVKPNIDCIEGVGKIDDLKKYLLTAVDRLDASSIRLDLAPLIKNQDFVNKLSRNLKTILKTDISRLS